MLRSIIAAFTLFSLCLAPAGAASTGTAPGSLAAGFRTPPDAARPWVYWFWVDGNLTREGITADLEAMHRAGIRGAIIMEVDALIPKGQVRFLSPQWRSYFQLAVKEATRLGIELDMNNDGGWTGSGGPWITPELSMQVLVWSESRISGPGRIGSTLAQPKTTEGYYGDIAVLAFPTPPAEALRMAAANPRFTLGPNHTPLDAGKLADGNAGTVEMLPALKPGDAHTIDIDFPQPFPARALTLASDRYQSRLVGKLAVSADGQSYRTVREFEARWPVAAVNFDPVTARHFRLTLAHAPGNTLAATMPLGEVELLGGGRIEDIAGKAAFVNEPFPLTGTGPAFTAAMLAGRSQVLDISSHVDKTGRLTWDAPAGSWTVLRIGHTSTGKMNHPSPKEGLGFECDKLSKQAVDVHFAGLLGKLLADQPAGAATALRYAHIDSWETGSQNWTPKLREEFRARRGYDLLPYLPVVTGRAVESQEVSERFLWDLRRTVADMVLENYAGHFKQLCQKNGLKLSIEAYGNGPLDDIPYAGLADLPMTEFWMGLTPSWINKEMASAAHTYGRPVLGAEAFTSRSPAGKWQNHPFRLKPLGDQMFTQGVNRIVFHRYAMQPWSNRWPGMGMGPYGIEFDRTVTWWEQSHAYLDYLSRCQFLLQEGRFFADIAYLSGEKVPIDFPPPSTLSPEPPPGYDYDAVSAELLAQMTVRDGRPTLPSGMSYRVLVLPNANTMRVAQLRKIKELVEAGATLVGPPPVKSPSLAEMGSGDAEVRRLAAELWGGNDGANLYEHRAGKGKVVWGKPLANVLAEAGAGPDFGSLDLEAGKQIRYIHRTIGGKEVYFVSSNESQAATFLCSFRVTGKRPELWWPDTGRTQAVAIYDQQPTLTRVPVRLDPYGSVFVVFSSDVAAAPERLAAVTKDGVEVSGVLATSVADLRNKLDGVTVESSGTAQYRLEVAQGGTYAVKTASGKQVSAVVPNVPEPVEVTGPWELSFPKGWGAPDHVTLDRLASWTAHPLDGVKYFSGTATYRRSITIPAAMLGENHGLYLDLGRVEVIAEVRLNGHDLGVLWKPPFRVDIRGAAKAGPNELEVRVVNLWPNRLIGDAQLPEDSTFDGGKLREWPEWLLAGRPSPTGRLTFATWRHWRKDGALLESGLLGPVRLEATTQVLLDGAK
jgi:hypothetical protein